MGFNDIQMMLTVVAVLTAAAALVFIDHRRKRAEQPQRIQIQNKARTSRPQKVFDAEPIDYAPVKRLATERPLEPLVAVATASRPPVEPKIELDTVTVEMALPSPAAPSETVTASVTLPAFTIDAALWEHLIASQPRQTLLATPAPTMVAAIQPEAPTRGVIQRPVLDELLEENAPFTGLLVSIGVNDSESGMWHAQGLMQSVGSYIAGLLKPSEFYCRTAYDEFVMVCPGEQGAHSQRRLNHISERLWDYQLRGIGTCSILFSWGGVQVYEQPLAEAFSAAIDRMRETKRSGQSASTQVAQHHAV